MSDQKQKTPIIAISSCKGGVGKSTLAAQIALELVQQGKKVGLLDVDIYGPSIPSLFGIYNPKLQTNDKKQIIPIEHNGLKLMSFGFMLGDKPAVMRGPIVTRYLQQILLNCDWGELDYLLIDMPPGTGDIHITITQSIRLSGAVIITTPHNLSLIDVARGILMFEKVSIPILGVIENMAYFQIEESDKKHFVFGKPAAATLTNRFGIEALGEIPLLPKLTENFNEYTSNSDIKQSTDQILKSLENKKNAERNVPNIYADEKNISLTWSDGEKQTVSNFDLRLNSQDALSVDEMTGKSRLKPEDIRKDIKALKITPLGNYAIGIDWNDGHSAGIYTYTLIKKLAAK